LNLKQGGDEDNLVGLDINTGECLDPIQSGIFDNVNVKAQMIEVATYTASQLLYVDEIIRAGKKSQGSKF
jgi:T-complex protein 1 subunit zeta